jgi:hypothetical protein
VGGVENRHIVHQEIGVIEDVETPDRLVLEVQFASGGVGAVAEEGGASTVGADGDKFEWRWVVRDWGEEGARGWTARCGTAPPPACPPSQSRRPRASG